METIGGIDAIRMMQEVSKLPDGHFTIAFYKYNRTLDQVYTKLQVRERCRARAQLPQDRFQIPSDNFFLFQDEEGIPKTCYRILVRFVGFPPEYKLIKVNWFKDE
ncbi:MAG: hypothetical protein V2B15_08620 [Bacteroidota bacterium]